MRTLVGARYRYALLPPFIEHLVVGEGAAIQSHTVGLELDLRHPARSTIPWVTYTDHALGPMLVMDRNAVDIPQSYSFVSGHLRGITAGVDELWSAPLDANGDLAFEYGAGVGLGVVLGNVEQDWVYLVQPGRAVPPGSIQGSGGYAYAICPAGSVQPGCNVQDHPGATTARTAGYSEPGWLSGGWVPLILPYVALPEIGLRWQISRSLAARLHGGFSLAGFWAGLAIDEDVTSSPSP